MTKYRVRKINPEQYVIEILTEDGWVPCDDYGDPVGTNETFYYAEQDAIDCAKFFEKDEIEIVYETPDGEKDDA